MKVITACVILVLCANFVFVGLVIYLEWKPAEDVVGDFETAKQKGVELSSHTVITASVIGESSTMDDQFSLTVDGMLSSNTNTLHGDDDAVLS